MKNKGRFLLYFSLLETEEAYKELYNDAESLVNEGKKGYVWDEKFDLFLSEKPFLRVGRAPKDCDVDFLLKSRPDFVITDIAAKNSQATRNKKRFQDAEELLAAGIDVFSSITLQNIESLSDVISVITGHAAQNTVPDSVFDRSEVKYIDIPYDENDGYDTKTVEQLRALALRKAAEHAERHETPAESSQPETKSKFLVCISSSPSSEKVIKWTARTAGAFRARWTALYVETPNRNMSKEDSARLAENIRLAKSFGAEIVRLEGYDIAESVSEYAKQSDITNIVIGKSRNKRSIKNFLDKDLENKIIDLLDSVEIHIIPDNKAALKNTPAARAKPTGKAVLKECLKTFAVLLAATLLCAALEALGLSETNLILIYVLAAVVVALFTNGFIFGIFASAASVLLLDFLFTEPRFAFHVIQSRYIVIFITMLIVSGITGVLTMRLKSRSRNAVLREKRMETLYNLTRSLLRIRGKRDIMAFADGFINDLFDCKTVFYFRDGKGVVQSYAADAETGPSDIENEIVSWVFLNRKSAGSGTDTFSGAEAYYFPVHSQEKVFAVIALSRAGAKFGEEEKVFLSMLFSQIALALERQELSDSQSKIKLDAEREKLRGNLLRSVSHDLRTPLTSIYGSASAMLENQGLGAETSRQLTEAIRDDSQWLIRMVENLLTVTKIQGEGLKLKKEPEAVEEIIAEAVSRTKARLNINNVKVIVPDELLIVPMDGTLIEQVLINLLENSFRHSKTSENIEIEAYKAKTKAVIKVSDRGIGLSDNELKLINKGLPDEIGSASGSKKGMGIGLSICHSIVKAHGGSLTAANRSEGGAEFFIALPLEK